MSGKIKKAFLEVRADESLKEQTFDRILSKNKKTKPIIYKLSIAAAAVLIFFIGGIYYTPVSYISIDINPSIELSINAFDKIVDVSATNQDGENIINSLDLKNLNYIEALETLNNDESFIDFTDSYTEVTIISDNSDEMINNITNCGFHNENMAFNSANVEMKNKALESGISFGKYYAYIELLEINPNIDIEEIKNLSMKEIRDIIENNGELTDDNTPLGGNKESENNQGQGNGNKNQFGKEN